LAPTAFTRSSVAIRRPLAAISKLR
jgi:hypothetical protein